MPRVLDVEVKTMGITPKEHPVRRAGSRIRWPFKAMITGDYFVIDRSLAEKAKNAMKAFKKRQSNRWFSIRPKTIEGQVFIVRRVG